MVWFYIALAVLIGGLVLAVYIFATLLVVPYLLYAAGLGVIVGVAAGLTATVTVFTGTAGTTPRTATPGTAFTSGVRWGPRAAPMDYAWPQYFLRQVGYDAMGNAELTVLGLRILWARCWRLIPRLPRLHGRLLGLSPTSTTLGSDDRNRTWTLLIGWPLLAVPYAGLVGVTIGALLVVAVVLLTCVVVTALAYAGGAFVIGVSRTAARVSRRVGRTRFCCPRCFHLIDLPLFACPGPHRRSHPRESQLHKELRPGRQGIWQRRCGCGLALPAGLPAAARRMRPYCPKCRSALPAGAGAATNVRIAVFGAGDAGKTRLIDTAVRTLVTASARSWAGAKIARLDPVPAQLDAEAREGVARDGVVREAVARDGVRPGGIGLVPPPSAVTLQIGETGRGALVHIFDAEGSVLVDADQNASLAYFDDASSLMFALDPFSIPALRTELRHLPAHLAPAGPVATDDPEYSYLSIVSALQHRGVDTRRQRLAFVVTKADALAMLAIGRVEASSQGVSRWLDEHGMEKLVIYARRDFGEVKFFRTAAAGGTPDAVAPLRWLLGREGIRFVDGGSVR